MSQHGPYGNPGGPGMQGYPQQQPQQKPKSSAGVTCLIILVCSVPVLGVLASLAIYGTRRYLTSAKTAEAKNTIGAIGRSQVAAFEANGKLCGSAPPVPVNVPSGRKYQPNSAPGQDFDQGTPDAGWRCLKLNITTPMYFSYEVRVGSDYKGPARGGADPGLDGFEISAEGDLDGDGQTSLFIQTGTVDRAAKKVVLSPMIFVVDENE